MKKAICALVAVLLVPVTTVFATSSNFKVTPAVILDGGTILYVGGDGPGNYTKIQDAIENATSGDTIFVYDDSTPYFETLMIN